MLNIKNNGGRGIFCHFRHKQINFHDEDMSQGDACQSMNWNLIGQTAHVLHEVMNQGDACQSMNSNLVREIAHVLLLQHSMLQKANKIAVEVS